MTVIDDLLRSGNVPSVLPRPMRAIGPAPQPLAIGPPPGPLPPPTYAMPTDLSLAHQLGGASRPIPTPRQMVGGAYRGFKASGLPLSMAGIAAQHYGVLPNNVGGALVGAGIGQGTAGVAGLGSLALKRSATGGGYLAREFPRLAKFAMRVPGPPALKLLGLGAGALAGLGGSFNKQPPPPEPIFYKTLDVLQQHGASPEDIAQAQRSYQLQLALADAQGVEVDENALAQQALAPVIARVQAGGAATGTLTPQDVLAAQMMARDFIQPSTNQALRALETSNQLFDTSLAGATGLPAGMADAYRVGNQDLRSLMRQRILAQQAAAELGPQLAYQRYQEGLSRAGGGTSDTLSLLDSLQRPPG